MRLSDLDPKDVTLTQAAAQAPAMRLSDLHPDDVRLVTESNPAATSPVTAATTGIINGASLGLAPRIGAATKTAMDAITGVAGPLAGGTMADLGDEYNRELASLRGDFNQSAAAHPHIALAGNIAGSLPTMGAMGPVAATPEGLAAIGGVQGAAQSDDLTDAPTVARNAVVGAGTGLAAGVAAPYIAKGVGAVGSSVLDNTVGRVGGYFSGKGEALVRNATGATAAEAKQFVPGTERYLLDNKIVGFGSSPAEIAARAQAAMDASGQGISSALGKLDSQGVTVDRNTVLDYIRQKMGLLSTDESQTDLVRALQGKTADIEAQIPEAEQGIVGYRPTDKPVQVQPAVYANDAYLNDPSSVKPARYIFGDNTDQWAKLRGAQVTPPVEMTPIEPRIGDLPVDSTIPISKAEQVKRGFQDKVNWKSDDVANNANTTVSDAYRQSVEDAATAADPAMADQFKADKETYGLLKPVRDASLRRAGVLNQSPALGLLDTATAGTELLSGHPLMAVAAPVARRAIAPRIAAAGAVSADQIGTALSAAPQAFGRFAGALQSAAARGSQALASAHYVLSQSSSEYREQLKQAFPDSE